MIQNAALHQLGGTSIHLNSCHTIPMDVSQDSKYHLLQISFNNCHVPLFSIHRQFNVKLSGIYT